jgi:hypothetical protein
MFKEIVLHIQRDIFGTERDCFEPARCFNKGFHGGTGRWLDHGKIIKPG